MPFTAEQRVDYDAERRGKQRLSVQNVRTLFGDRLDAGPVNPQRRERGAADLLEFCKIYLAKAFYLPWSPNHIRAAERIQAAVHGGTMFAFAMPRGSGKTTLCRAAAVWAVLCGHSPYVVLIGATEKASKRNLKNIKRLLRFNDLLLDDFPEACCAIRHLADEARKASGQRDGPKDDPQPTLIEWTQDHIVLPTMQVDYSKSSGAIIDVASIEGEIRGRQHEKQDGSVSRPTLAILDDPQTRESAKSVSQSEQREEIVSGDVKYMAGPDQPLGVVMPCTVIVQGDMADRMLNRKLHPEWQGEKTRMVESFPENEKLWEEYRMIRQESFDNDGSGEESNAFYIQNREEMDAGAAVSWPDRFFADYGEVSAIQHAMNIKFLDEAAFYAEYQNEPLSKQENEVEVVTAEQIASKASGVKEGMVPSELDRLTAFIDVSEKVLWWSVCGWRDDFTGSVLEYGVWPEQPTRYVTLASVRKTLVAEKKGAGFEAALLHGLERLTDHILGREWRTEGGTILKIQQCLIDANFGRSTDTVYSFCRRSPHASVLLPSHGRGVKASGARRLIEPTDKRKMGERLGLQWRINKGREGMQKVLYDTNFWKSWVFNRLAVPVGDPGCLTVWGKKPARPAHHRMFAEQLTAEYPVRVEANGRTVDEWQLRPGRDNHFLDCIVGNAVAASIQGVKLPGVGTEKQKQSKKRMKLSELQGRR